MLLHDILPRHPRQVTAALWSDHQPPDTRLQHCSSLQRCLHKCPPADNLDGSIASMSTLSPRWAAIVKSMNKIFSVMFYLKIYKHLFAPPWARPAGTWPAADHRNDRNISQYNKHAGWSQTRFYTFLYIFGHFVKTFPNR